MKTIQSTLADKKAKKPSKIAGFFKGIGSAITVGFIIGIAIIMVTIIDIKFVIIGCTFAVCYCIFSLYHELEIISKYTRKYFKRGH